jgi:hypothetical protein
MAEDTAPAAPDAPTDKPDGESGTTTFTQDQVNDLIAKEKGKIQSRYEGFDDLKAKAAELDSIKEANASELEKAQGKATKAEQRAEKAEARLLRFEVAKDKEIPAEAVDLLSGSSREDLEASADKILNLVKSRNDNTAPDFDGGARDPAPEPLSPEEQHNRDIVAALFSGTRN